MFNTHPDNEFKNVTRSTLPLLAYWKDRTAVLSLIGSACEISDLASATVTEEFPTASAAPHDKASFTDVMVVSSSTALAIEGKWTEPRYEIVSDWLKRGDQSNRKKVLSHWLTLIRSKAKDLKETGVADVPYQMIHRTASACAFADKRPVVLYQIFRDGKHAVNYVTDLKRLADALGSTDVRFWVQEIPLTLTDDYRRTKHQVSEIQAEHIPGLVRRALWEGKLFRFGEPTFNRIT